MNAQDLRSLQLSSILGQMMGVARDAGSHLSLPLPPPGPGGMREAPEWLVSELASRGIAAEVEGEYLTIRWDIDTQP